MLHRYRATGFGAEFVGDAVRFRLWAPSQRKVSIVLDEKTVQAMRITDDGWYDWISQTTKTGTRYQFELEDGRRVPDPASRYQPCDVHGPSELVDPRAYEWNDTGWLGRPWEEAIIYEIHVGAFTREGTFRAAIERLDWLSDLGVTAIEIMPLADFPGRRNWGYDGVLLFAPDSGYGRPEDFKALVDAAHARGIMVFLDVVYNHFGPDGNYLPAYSPIFTKRHETPWGAAVNYDSVGSKVVRQFVIENAIYWVEEFHLDGLRLDAVHAIKDDSEKNILDEIAARVRQAVSHRPVHLLIENEENDVALLARGPDNVPYRFTAQWNDDIHHALHTAATGETSGYYIDYAGDTKKLGRALAEGFAFQGETMEYSGSPRGGPSAHLPPTAFVSFIQNHDQVGNRALGERLFSLAEPEALRAIIAVYLLLPQIPMLFMGDEFGATQPFPYFCDFEPEVAKEVRGGRRAEFARFPEFKDPEKRKLIPDPTAETTYDSAKLDWGKVVEPSHAEWSRLHRELLAIRHREIVPRLKGIGGHAAQFEVLASDCVSVQWELGDGSKLRLFANLSSNVLSLPQQTHGRRIWPSTNVESEKEGSWWVGWTIEE